MYTRSLCARSQKLMAPFVSARAWVRALAGSPPATVRHPTGRPHSRRVLCGILQPLFPELSGSLFDQVVQPLVAGWALRASATKTLDQPCSARCRMLCGSASRNRGVASNSTARALSAVWHEARIIICLPGSAPRSAILPHATWITLASVLVISVESLSGGLWRQKRCSKRLSVYVRGDLS
jgi:hypothetical protein